MSSIFSVFKRGLQKTQTAVARTLASVFTGVKAWNDSTFEDIEGALISADFGVAASTAIVGELRDRYRRGLIETTADAYQATSKLVREMLMTHQRAIRYAPAGTPTVILFVGVNGSGKTTSIGKLAWQWHSQGKKVILAAGDTFRAAAVEQLKLWGERTDSVVIASSPGADPASVAFDAAQAAVSRKADFLLIDTAGRQHTKKGLMDELTKITRAIEKACPGAPHEVWLTVDASMGGNAVNQAREFSRAAQVTGLVLTKLDGSGKGGMAVALHREFSLPTFFVGLGEQPDDLQEFNAEFYTDALFGADD